MYFALYTFTVIYLTQFIGCNASEYNTATQDCPQFASETATQSIDASNSHIRGNLAYIQLDCPSYYEEVKIDFRVPIRENWTAVNDVAACTTSYWQEFTFEELKAGGLSVNGSIASFWLDFDWVEPVNSGPFGTFDRHRQQDLPFTLTLPRTHSLSMAIKTMNPPSEVEHETPVNDTIGNQTIFDIINKTAGDSGVYPDRIVVTNITYKFRGKISGNLLSNAPSAAPSLSRRNLFSESQKQEIVDTFIDILCDDVLNISRSQINLWLNANNTIEFTMEFHTFEIAQSIQDVLEATEADPQRKHDINEAIPNFRIQSIKVDSNVFAVVYMEIKYPTLSPTTTPTAFPTSTPSFAPVSPARFPTSAPFGDFKEDMLLWVLHGAAQEINENGESTVEITFVTATQKPWTLSGNEVVLDTHVIQTIEFNETTSSFTCGPTFTDICQTWKVVVEVNRECTNGIRNIHLNFFATRGHVSHPFTLPVEISGSSAFSCAVDLGNFGMTTAVRYSNSEYGDWGASASAYLGETVWFEITFASGWYAISGISLDNFTITTSQLSNNPPICTDCHQTSAFSLGASAHPSKYVFGFRFDEPEFTTVAYTLELDFKISFDLGAQTRRLLLVAQSQDDIRRKSLGIPILFTIEKRPEETSINNNDTNSDKDMIEYDVRFDYDCALISTDESEARFLEECNELMHPVLCTKTRCGSIIVTFEARSRLEQGRMLSKVHENGLTLPSFGFAEMKLDADTEETDDENNQSIQAYAAKHSFLLFTITITLAIVILACAYSMGKPTSHVEEH